MASSKSTSSSSASTPSSASAASPPPEGRRERKKRETRQRISDIATGLMLERGFDAVTVAEIADAADVSVNTVYNYFGAKEDLFFDREEEMTERPSRIVRERAPGESAADALLARLREDVETRSVHGGVLEGFDKFARCVREAPTLVARLHAMQQRTVDRLAATLREETAAEDGDPRPELVADQLVRLSHVVVRSAAIGVAQGVEPDEAVRRALQQIDTFESLVTDALLNYAVRPGE